MTDGLYREFEAGVTHLEEELKVSLITRSGMKGMKGMKKGLEQGRREAILEFAEARFGSLPEGLATALQDVSDGETLARLTRLAAQVASPEDLLEAVREARGG